MQLRRDDSFLEPLHVSVSGNDRDQLAADLERQPVDFTVLEVAAIEASEIAFAEALRRQSLTQGVLLVYRFARSADLLTARDAGMLLARSPVETDGISSQILRAAEGHRRPSPGNERSLPNDDPSAGKFPDIREAAARRFTASQLARLTQISTAIDCECPNHLAQLVNNLAAFEIYSSRCASRDEDDAELHRYLHMTSAVARAQIEDALARVVEHEGIEI